MRSKTIVLLCVGGALLLAGLARGLYLGSWIVAYRYIGHLCETPGVRETLQREPEVWQPSAPEGTRVALGWYSVCLANTDVKHAKVMRGGIAIEFGDGLAMALLAPSGTGTSPASGSVDCRAFSLFTGRQPVTWAELRSVPRNKLEEVCVAAMMKSSPEGSFGTAHLETLSFLCFISGPIPDGARYCMGITAFSKRSDFAAGMRVTGPDAAQVERAVRNLCASLEFDDKGSRYEDVSLDDLVNAISTWVPSDRIEVPESERQKSEHRGTK